MGIPVHLSEVHDNTATHYERSGFVFPEDSIMVHHSLHGLLSDAR